MLVEPERVGVSADEFLRVHTFDGGRAADSDLFAVHEDGHEILLTLFLAARWAAVSFFFGLAMISR